jgi:4-hydroxybenzoyl-CoA reductase subunit beta
MLRMPEFQLATPKRLADALALAREHGSEALFVAGGTDLVPNLKHRLHTPKLLISLGNISDLRGVRVAPDGGLVIGAMTTLDALARQAEVARRAPALAQAASIISGPQLRRMGTLGGNLMLDTRCQWVNQTYFWRQALGFCLKKDGTKCHVVEGGQNCVAAASNDTAPALLTLRARVRLASPDGSTREVEVASLYSADGISNKRTTLGEILTEVVIPAPHPGHRGAYGKLRDRGSIDFPLLGVAVRLDLGADGRIAGADLAAVALAARPVQIRGAEGLLQGVDPADAQAFDTALEAVARLAHRQCHPLPNIPGDAAYRREMVPVYVRRTLRAAASGVGPVT